MPATVIVGLQWGDEGKGKTTDFLAEQVAMVVRYQGGDNAGHTVQSGSEVFKLHLVPSGVLYPHISCVIGPGVVVNPDTLIRELDTLAARGIETAAVRVSRNSHVIMPYHLALDRAMEARLAGDAVGTTHRGIGPAYADRAWRVGVRMEDLLDSAVLREKLERLVPDRNSLLAAIGSEERFENDALVELAAGWGSRLTRHLADTTWLVQDALRRGDHVLLEGAQGTLLDLDHGSYPFVTSSNPIAGGACTGGGIGPLQVDEVIGVRTIEARARAAIPFSLPPSGPTSRPVTTSQRRRIASWPPVAAAFPSGETATAEMPCLCPVPSRRSCCTTSSRPARCGWTSSGTSSPSTAPRSRCRSRSSTCSNFCCATAGACSRADS